MSRRPLALALLGLAALYAWWYAGEGHVLAAMLVFVLPPVGLAIAAWRGWRRAGFVAGVLALLWFSHGVMLAWSEPAQRIPASIGIALSLAIVYAASIDGIRARFGKRR